MAVLSNDIYNVFITSPKIEIRDYKNKETLSLVFNFEWEDDVYEHSYYESSIKSPVAKGLLRCFVVDKGAVIKVKVKNITHRRFNLSIDISSPQFILDDLRDVYLLSKSNVLVLNPYLKTHNSVVSYSVDPLKSIELHIYIGDKHYFDKEGKEVFNNLHTTKILSGFEFKTDNETLNRMMYLCKMQIISSVKRSINEIVEVDNPYRYHVASLLLDLGEVDFVKQLIERRYFKGYELLYLLKKYVSITGDTNFSERMFGYAHKVRVNDDNIVARYLYSPSLDVRQKVIELLGNEEELVSKPLEYYLFLRVYDNSLPQSIKDYALLKLLNENHEFKELINRIELRDYHYLLDYLKTHYNPFVSAVIFRSVLHDYVNVDVDEIRKKLTISISPLIEESRVMYRDVEYKHVDIDVIYDKERNRVSVNTTPLHRYDLYVELPSKDVEVYINNKKLTPKEHKFIVHVG